MIVFTSFSVIKFSSAVGISKHTKNLFKTFYILSITKITLYKVVWRIRDKAKDIKGHFRQFFTDIRIFIRKYIYLHIFSNFS